MAVGAVICAHDGFHFRLGHELFERGQIGLRGVAPADLRVEPVAFGLGSAVTPEMLRASGQLQIFRALEDISTNPSVDLYELLSPGNTALVVGSCYPVV